MNVLSVFDGMSCGQIALERANIKVNKYYASEIDQYAIKVTQKNYPNTIQLGNVEFITGHQFAAIGGIDLFIGGSPCQGFSFAGKQLNFKDPRSALFFEYVRILNELRKINKDVLFLMENVKMKKEYQDIITKCLGVEPIEINSALVSAQNRKRLYWTNITGIEQPKNKGIVLNDIIENGDALKNKSQTILSTLYKENTKSMLKRKKHGLLINESATSNNKAYSLTASYNGAVAWNSCERNQRTMIPISESNDKHPNVYNGIKYRKLTPIECERLQTVPDNYTSTVSNTQRYKMLGNGWTVDIIAHIFKSIDS